MCIVPAAVTVQCDLLFIMSFAILDSMNIEHQEDKRTLFNSRIKASEKLEN